MTSDCMSSLYLCSSRCSQRPSRCTVAATISNNQARPLVAADFLAKVRLEGDPESIIPDSSTLSQLRAHMQVKPLLHPAMSTGSNETHGQERLILVTLISPSTGSRLDQDFSETTSVWIPGLTPQPNLVVKGKFHAMTVGYVGQFPHVDGVDVLKQLIHHVYQPQYMGCGTGS